MNLAFNDCMPELNKKNQLQFLDSASNLGLVAWTGSELLYWGKKIDAWQLGQDKIRLLLRGIINIFLILFSVVGFLSLGVLLFEMQKAGMQVWKFYNVQNGLALIFWLSMLINLYIFYRLQRELEKFKHIPRRAYHAGELPHVNTISLEDVKGLKKEQKVNISNFFTHDAIAAINKSYQVASNHKHPEVKQIHLFLSLLSFAETKVVFSRLGVEFEELTKRISSVLGRIQPQLSKVEFSDEVYQGLFRAYFSAWELRQGKVDVPELLDALMVEGGEVYEILYDLDIDKDKINNVVAWINIKKTLREQWLKFRGKATLKPSGNMDRAMTAIATPLLDTFSKDLTLLARAGYLMPCIGRDDEIQEIFRIMQGGTRRSVILLAEHGVGKQTIIDGIAKLMVSETVPAFLQDKRLVSLDIAKLVSGVAATEAQQRILMILSQVVRSGNIVLVINNIHTLTGITSGDSGSMDLAGTLSQAVTNSGALIIATSTPNKYRRYVEGKSSLENIFEPVVIKEVEGNVAIRILEAKSGAIEYRNKVYFSYDSIASTVNLSSRYLHDRYLPEKAIEILQEVATMVNGVRGNKALVTANDVAEVISKKTNIPLTKITQTESDQLMNLEEKIHQRIIGQDKAVDMVASSLRRARAQMRDEGRPIVNLLFLGPTGVGKTELAKTVAAVYFGDQKNMVRIDMSEYQEKSSISRLIGASPEHGGEPGYLTEIVRKNPFSLILFDEIEKAHPDILNVLLQVMDDGRLTDTSGKTIDFTNTIIIGTSNAASQFIQDSIKAGTQIEIIQQQLIDTQLGSYFRPEFLNRFDGLVVFTPLSLLDVEKIASLMLKDVASDLGQKGIEFEITPQALSELAKAGYDPKFGARPLRRVIQSRVQDQLANYIISGKVNRRDKILVGPGIALEVIKARQF